MHISFYETYQSFSKEELFKVVMSPDDYQPDALIAAKKIIVEKGWTEDLHLTQEEEDKRKAEQQELYEEDIIEKAEYYKNVVKFKNQRNSFQVRISDMPRFEAALEEKNIEFFREDKNIGVQLDSYPTQSYFFKTEDTDAVDALTKELKLITAPYADAKPYFGWELKVVAVVVGLTLLLMLIF